MKINKFNKTIKYNNDILYKRYNLIQQSITDLHKYVINNNYNDTIDKIKNKVVDISTDVTKTRLLAISNNTRLANISSLLIYGKRPDKSSNNDYKSNKKLKIAKNKHSRDNLTDQSQRTN